MKKIWTVVGIFIFLSVGAVIVLSWSKSPDVISLAREISADSQPVVKPTEPPKNKVVKIQDQHLVDYCENPHGATCSTQWPSVDPTGKVQSDVTGEVLALRKLRDIIRKNPTWQSEQIDEELAQILYTPKRTALIRSAFDWVIKNMSDFILERPAEVLSQNEKTQILDRILKIKLEIPPPASVYQNAPDLLTKNTVYYERTSQGEMKLRIGGAYLLNATSWYNLVFTFAHEIAHSIDPCEMKFANLVPAIYEPLTKCFVKMAWVHPDFAHCKKGEQVSEVFSDWMATQMATRALIERGQEYSPKEKVQSAVNFARDLCEQSTSPDTLNTLFHQAPQVRVGSIIGQSPYVRGAIGCSRKVVRSYCEMNLELHKGQNEEAPQ